MADNTKWNVRFRNVMRSLSKFLMLHFLAAHKCSSKTDTAPGNRKPFLSELPWNQNPRKIERKIAFFPANTKGGPDDRRARCKSFCIIRMKLTLRSLRFRGQRHQRLLCTYVSLLVSPFLRPFVVAGGSSDVLVTATLLA